MDLDEIKRCRGSEGRRMKTLKMTVEKEAK